MEVRELVEDLQRAMEAAGPETEVMVSGLYSSEANIQTVELLERRQVCNLGHEHGKLIVWIRTDLFTG